MRKNRFIVQVLLVIQIINTTRTFVS